MSDSFHISVSSNNQGITEAEVRVTAELELIQQILNSSDDCIKVLDLEGRILFMSKGGQALLGIQDITQFLNKTWADFWQGVDQQAAMEAIAKARAGEVYTFEGYRPTFTGEPKWWDSKISPIRDAAGQIERLLCISRDITARKCSEDKQKKAEEQLQQSEQHLSAIFSQAAVGLSEISLDGHFLRVNDEICRILGRSREEMLATSVPDITHPEDILPSLEAFKQLLETSKAVSLDKRYVRPDGTIVWANSSLTRLDDEQGNPRTVLVVTVDLTDRKQAALNAEFLAKITQNLVSATSINEIVSTVGEQLNNYFKTSICAFIEINQSADKAVIHHDWHQEDVPSLEGVYHLPEFVSVEFFQTAKAGGIIIVRDVTTDSRIANQARFAALKIGSFINIPLIRDNRWKFTLGVFHQTPYNWRSEEIELLRELANRIWAKLERIRVEIALRESEEKYRMLFDSLDEAFCICEMLFDEKGEPIDYRFLEVNPVFEMLTGLKEVLGKTARELVPNLEHHWIEIYSSVVRTGKPIRVEQQSIAMNRWFDVSAFCVGEPQSHLFAVLFTNTSDRKKVEQERERFLAVGSDLLVITGTNGYFQWVSPTFERLLGWTKEEMTSQPWTEFVHPEDTNVSIAETDSLFLGHKTFAFENRYRHKDGSYRWLLWKAHSYSEEQVIYGGAVDITDRKRREANLAFLAEISEEFSHLSSADEIMQVVGAKIGTYLKITTCNFADVDEERGEVRANLGWNATDEPSTVGTFRITQYLSGEFKRASRAGETVVIRNTQTDPRTDGPSYAALNMYAFVTVPFQRNGRWTHYIAICDSQPRDWRDDEIELIEEISNRIFPRLERARAEDALRKSEAKYRSLFESMDEGFCILQLIFDEQQKPIDYRYLEINPVFEQQTGMQNALGRTIRELVPDIEPFWFEIYGKIALTGEPMRVANQSESMGRWFDVYAFRVGEPQEHKVAVLFNDISDRKQAEAEREQLLANERLYANQLQGLTSATLAINSALSVEEVLQVITKQAAAIIGSHQAVTSMTINQNWAQGINAVHLSDKYAAWRNYNELPDGSGIYSYVCHLNRPIRMTQAELEAHPGWKGFSNAAGKHPPLRGWLAAPLVGRDGNNIGLIQLSDKFEGEFTTADESILVQLAQMASVAVENARLYEAEQQARAAAEASREEAQAANRVKDEFLAVLSHELRSPLNPILGWSTLLLKNKLDAAKTAQALATIQRNAKLQSELIEDLLDVSRILRGKLNLNVVPVNLAAIIRAAMETVRLAAEAKSIQVEAILALDVGLVWGDSTRLQQVIWNLISNAVKFTSEGGQVDVQLERLDSFAQITVRDTGQGIAPDFLPFVFDYFRQADAATTRKFGGLGLGLAIVRHLVELHGGTVKVESPGEGQGATFTVQLPLNPTPAKVNSDVRSPDRSFSLNGIKILVVDDETDTRELVTFLLEEQGAQVTAASSAREALLVLTQLKPDVLLSDIGMPEMDGYMLIQQVRNLAPEQGGQIPAIALTAYAGEMNQQQVIAAGFQKHISKPIEPDVLIQAIAQLISA
jgi:PAS domain S-box-containing protein